MPEKMTEEDEKWLSDMLEKMAKSTARETDICFQCGKQVTQLRQVGHCVYAAPCNCRIWQGKVPEAWK